MAEDWRDKRNQIIGLGDNSYKKSYYPQLQEKIAEIESSYSNLINLFNSINDAVIIHDENGKLYQINKKAKELYNIDDADLDNVTLNDISSSRNNLDFIPEICKTVMDGESPVFDWILVKYKTNIESYVQVSLNTVMWYGEKRIVAVVRDFTERMKFEMELVAAKEKAQEGDRLKTAFLHNLSHEIRTPLNAICGFADFLSEPSVTENERKSYISIIQKSSTQLLSIITDILTISFLDTMQERVKNDKVCINEVIRELNTIFSSRASNAGLLLHTKTPLDDAQSEIYTDRTKITQILTNLLNNALRFTSDGFIEFGYRHKENNLEFFVKDSGIGIKPEFHKKIFERFTQAEISISEKYGGTGLGLAISKSFTELLGGKIWLESEPGKGSVFYFTIPIKLPLEKI
ncbi:MAG: hybrid sensor histidine kinase/response regulator [Bacteroidetes bacterium]|nr:hybrid sensor histidine kinase/response regulator [Bacteroidota bacterium]